MKRFVVDGATAIVTGAAGGIGRATARELSARGAHLVLLDRDEPGLAALADEVRAGRADRAVTTYAVDLADRTAALATAEAIRDAHPHVHLLVNNAGVALGGRFAEVSLDDVEWLLAVNLHAVLLMTHTLLPSLVSTRGSHIVNISSLFGLIAPPGQVAYSASKFAVRGFGDALRTELAEHEVGVTTVHPGGIATSIAESARIGAGVDPTEYEQGRAAWTKLLSMDPAIAARKIVDGAERRKPRVLIGASTYVLDALARISPGHYGRLVAAGHARLTQRLSR
ncbi:MAG TPA: SDR family NAD(P)-dependent oxidoreductase [Candidatus Nanopelagicales bacterium]